MIFSRDPKINCFTYASLYKRSPNRLYTKAVKLKPEAKITFEINFNGLTLNNIPSCFYGLEKLEDIIGRFHQLSPCEGITEKRMFEIEEILTRKRTVPCVKRQGFLFSARCLWLENRGYICGECLRMKEN